MDKTEYLRKRNELLAAAEGFLNAGNIEGFNAKEKEIKNLDEEFDKIAKAQANMNALKNSVPTKGTLELEGVLDNSIQDVEPEDKFNTLGYRKAFMNYCKTGTLDSKFSNSDEFTSTTDAGAVIPTTIVQEIITKMESRGQIWSKVRKINIKGGVEVPILTLKPVASWIGENTVSDRKKVKTDEKVSFSYFGLECKVAISLLTDITTLDMFESTITKLIVEAMIKALEKSIVSGTGSGQPLGLVKDTRIPSDNIITLSAADFVTWEGWKKKVFAKIPLAYRAEGSFLMASGTFEGYVDGMVDSNGQPIGRINYNITNGPQERFGGRSVELVEDDVIAPYESASADDVVAVFCKLSDYAVNSNLQMTMYRWLDHDTNQYVDKAIVIADGKILDPNGVLIIKKGA